MGPRSMKSGKGVPKIPIMSSVNSRTLSKVTDKISIQEKYILA